MTSATIIKKRALEIWGHQGFQKYLKNTSWMFLGRMFSMIVSFFIGIYIARYLGPTNYGLLNYSISYVGLFAFIASMGIDSVIKRELVNNPEDKNNIIGTALAIKIAGSVLSILLIIITIFLLNPEPLVFGLIVLFSITYIFFSFDVFNSYFESQTQSKYPVGVAIFSSIVSAILKITFIFLGFGVVWLIAIYVLEALLTAIGMILIFINKVSGFKNLHFKTEIAKQIIKDSWPLMLSSFAVSIYLRIDQVMINSILGSAEVGIYAVAVKLAELWYFIPTIIGSSISPAIINSLKISEEAFENRLFKLYLLMISISLLIAIFVSLTSDWLIKILFGEEYISASPVLKIYIWSGIAVFLGVSVGYYLLAKNLTKLSFYTTLSGMITNVVLNIILIPNFGIKGAAIATLISYSISVLSILFFKETRKHAVFVFKKPIKKLKWDSRKILIKIKMIFEKLLHPSKKIKINIGAALDVYDGWISTDINTLDITKEKDWAYYFKENSVDSVLAEHVFEHLDMNQVKEAFRNIQKYLKKDGVFRMAVPDGNHPSSHVIELVKPGGTDHGSDDHKILFKISLANELANEFGFELNPLEHFDENGIFHKKDFNYVNGYISRCSKNYIGSFTEHPEEYKKMIESVPENLRDQFKQFNISYTSLLVDFIKK